MPTAVDKQRSKQSSGGLSAGDLRSLLESKGDITIGAYAEKRRRRRAFVAILGAGLLLIAGWFFFSLSGGDPPAGGTDYPAEMRCEYCGHEESRTARTSQQFPLMCDNCERRGVRPCWICRQCGKEFANPAKSEFFECPACRSLEIGSVVEAASNDE